MNATSQLRQKEFGDFQTPFELSNIMVEILKGMNIKPDIIIEPTCGLGTVLLDAYNNFRPSKTIGVEINDTYCNTLFDKLDKNSNISIINNDIFISIDKIKTEINRDDVCLLIGNPPWVTNSELGSLNSKNVPIKTNGASGIMVEEPIIETDGRGRAPVGRSWPLTGCGYIFLGYGLATPPINKFYRAMHPYGVLKKHHNTSST